MALSFLYLGGLMQLSFSCFALSLLFSPTYGQTAKTTFQAISYWQPIAKFSTGCLVPGQGSTQSESAVLFMEERLRAAAAQTRKERRDKANTRDTNGRQEKEMLGRERSQGEERETGQDIIGAKITSEYKDEHNGVLHAHFRQLLNGLPIENGYLKIAIDKENNVISWSSTFQDTIRGGENDTKPFPPPLSPTEALLLFATSASLSTEGERLQASHTEDIVNDVHTHWTISGASFSLGNVSACLKYYHTAERETRLVWSMEIEFINSWLNVLVDAESGAVLAVSDYYSHSDVPLFSQRGVEVGTIAIEYPALKERDRVFLSTQEILQRAVQPKDDHHGSRGRQDEETEPFTYLRSSSPSSSVSSTPSPPSFPLLADKSNARREHKDQLADEEEGKGDTAGGWRNVSYRVLPAFQGLNDPLDGSLALVTDPQDLRYSHLGWHDSGRGPEGITKGNNVLAMDNPSGSEADILDIFAAVSPSYTFDFPIDFTQEPASYRNASITNMFYVANIMHDLFSAYGFTSAAGNFQVVPNGGGVGYDPVVATCQDGSGKNNAKFATPPDGQPARMRLFIWTNTTPYRDGAFDNGVIIHEMTHGLSQRLTGGPDNANCLRFNESAGLNEGWSDFFGITLGMRASDKRETASYVLGKYVSGKEEGLRPFPYSTNMTINPQTYSFLGGENYPAKAHKRGSVWQSMLYEVYWNLVDKLGYTANVREDTRSGKGNTVMNQLIVDGMKLQPCNPTFIQARDAILQADRVNNEGRNVCDIWKGFAKRGLGFSALPFSARFSYENAFDLPPDCVGTAPAIL